MEPINKNFFINEVKVTICISTFDNESRWRNLHNNNNFSSDVRCTCVSLLVLPNYQGLLDHAPSVQKVPQLLLVNLYVGESDPVPTRR